MVQRFQSVALLLLLVPPVVVLENFLALSPLAWHKRGKRISWFDLQWAHRCNALRLLCFESWQTVHSPSLLLEISLQRSRRNKLLPSTNPVANVEDTKQWRKTSLACDLGAAWTGQDRIARVNITIRWGCVGGQSFPCWDFSNLLHLWVANMLSCHLCDYASLDYGVISTFLKSTLDWNLFHRIY